MVYVPAIAVVAALETVGLCELLEYELGPAHWYDAKLLAPPVKLSCCPAQIGPLFDAVAVGKVLTVTVVDAVF